MREHRWSAQEERNIRLTDDATQREDGSSTMSNAFCLIFAGTRLSCNAWNPAHPNNAIWAEENFRRFFARCSSAAGRKTQGQWRLWILMRCADKLLYGGAGVRVGRLVTREDRPVRGQVNMRVHEVASSAEVASASSEREKVSKR